MLLSLSLVLGFGSLSKIFMSLWLPWVAKRIKFTSLGFLLSAKAGSYLQFLYPSTPLVSNVIVFTLSPWMFDRDFTFMVSLLSHL
jgi:hypothetical protein